MADGTDANDAAITLVPAAVILMYLAWMGNFKTRVLCVLCGGLIANGLVLINSRGAFLGAATGVGIYLLYMLFSRFQKKRSEEHTSELQSRPQLVCRLLLEKKKK